MWYDYSGCDVDDYLMQVEIGAIPDVEMLDIRL